MMVPYDDQTIVARATPEGSGALAIVRLTGTTAISIAEAMSSLASGKKLSEVPTHTIHFGCVIDASGKPIDQVLFLVMKAPNSFTGQDTVEINCHNNPFIVEQIIHVALNNCARLADPGEFSKRAVLNNKIDLLQAEAINELIHAQTQTGLKQSLAQVEGSLSKWIITLEQALLKALAFCEASFEFIDEEMEFDKQIREIIDNVLSTISTLKKTYDYQKQIRQGIRIALIGAVNAGKSSLFNALLNQQRAIVTEVAGTTRDVIESGLNKDGNYWTLVDTAGLRLAENRIEQEGIRRSLREAELADIILLLYDGSCQLSQQQCEVYDELSARYPHKIILVATKSDLPRVPNSFAIQSLAISTETNQNLDKLEAAVASKVAQLFEKIESPFLLNQRQFKLIISLERNLAEIKKMLIGTVQFELVAHHLKDALSILCELTGRSISEKGTDQIFRQFCVGK